MRRFLLALVLLGGANERAVALDQGGSVATWADGHHGSRGEVRASCFRGFDDAPRITSDTTSLHQSFVKLEVVGVDGEVLAGSFVIRGEAGYFHFRDGGDDGFGLFQVEAEWSHAGWRVIGGYGDAIGGHPDASNPTSLDLAFLPAAFVHVGRGEPTE